MGLASSSHCIVSPTCLRDSPRQPRSAHGSVQICEEWPLRTHSFRTDAFTGATHVSLLLLFGRRPSWSSRKQWGLGGSGVVLSS